MFGVVEEIVKTGVVPALVLLVDFRDVDGVKVDVSLESSDGIFLVVSDLGKIFSELGVADEGKDV